MHLSFSPARSRRALGAFTGITLATLSMTATAFAQKMAYTDIPAGAYYEDAAASLILSGALDANEARLRPDDFATRAEVVKLLVNVYGRPLVWPTQASFTDVSRSVWYFPYMEAAAQAGWIRGDRECYGTGGACTARPASTVNRAEMAALLQRAFRLSHLSLAPVFADNINRNTWYFVPMQTAADHCILQGDTPTGLVRPAAAMRRAEMVVMFDRAQKQQRYGQDCAEPVGKILGLTQQTSRRIGVTYNIDIDPTRIDDTDRYSVEAANGTDIAVTDIAVTNARTVELSLGSSLQNNVSYTLRISSMRSENGAVFSDNKSFTFRQEQTATIENVTVRAANIVRVRYSTDLSASAARDTTLYALRRVGSSTKIGLQSITLVDNRTVDLNLSTNLAADADYTLSVEDMRTSTGAEFSDSVTFAYPSTAGNLTAVATISSNKLRLSFNTDLDEARAEQPSRYAVVSGQSTLTVSAANLLNDHRTVELTLGDSMLTQRIYTISVQDLLTTQNLLFNDSEVVVYDAGSVTFSALLTGIQEVPSVSTTATGTGSFTLTGNGLQYDITVQNLTSSLTAAHFHLGNSGTSGPVIQAITFSGNRSTGTWTGITNEQRSALLSRGIYVNVHTTNYPDGEIRGQLLPQ